MRIRRVATYRLQLRNGMTFDKAAGIVPYLKRLGISHLYASPIFTAVTGSTHGYDVTDHNEIDPALGGEEGFERLHAALRQAGMGLILDIVPNHMAAWLENRWWRSVVEHGPASPFAGHFDIDWSERLALPILGRNFRDALAAGELGIEIDHKHGCLALAYFDNFVPLHPSTYRTVAERIGVEELEDLADLAVPGDVHETFHDAVRRFLASGEAVHLAEKLKDVSADHAFLDRLHADQPWRLIFWKDARRHLSYRRFFEVTGLVGVRVEDAAVFDDVHRLILSLVRSGKVDGLRVDHVDGLACPGSYLRRLRQEAGAGTWILVEKILAEGEHLPPQWPDCGTTGYEFIPSIADLLTDAEGLREIGRAYERFIGRPIDRAAELRAAKLLILRRNFEGEFRALAAMAAGIAEDGHSLPDLEDAIAEMIVGFGVYRTYGETGELTPQDTDVLARAVRAALASGQADPGAVRFVASLLQSGVAESRDEDAAGFRIRFQQLTGPVMAKAVEDTLFYRLNPLIALNEVGSTPGTRSGSVERFHHAMRGRIGRPAGLLATATHDTKRGEDARARLHVLSEQPSFWNEAVGRWSAINEPFRRSAGGQLLPEPEVEWLVYQALAGIWPSFPELPGPCALGELTARFLPYVEKALREAKLRTDWLEIDAAYEGAVLNFVRGVLNPGNSVFLENFGATLRPVIAAGAINSLSQTLAKLTAPGIPDIYQGTELSDRSLVDPDNRRPVDFDALPAPLKRASGREAFGQALLDGSFKQWMIATCLACRKQNDALFALGSYEPLPVSGRSSRHFAAYLRRHGKNAALVVLQRLSLQRKRPDRHDADTFVHLPADCHGLSFRSVLTAERFPGADTIPLETALDDLPVLLALSRSRPSRQRADILPTAGNIAARTQFGDAGHRHHR